MGCIHCIRMMILLLTSILHIRLVENSLYDNHNHNNSHTHIDFHNLSNHIHHSNHHCHHSSHQSKDYSHFHKEILSGIHNAHSIRPHHGLLRFLRMDIPH